MSILFVGDYSSNLQIGLIFKILKGVFPMKKRKLGLFILVLALFSLLAACSGGSDSASTGSFYDQLKEGGKIRVGSTTTGPPFTFMNTEKGEVDGLMVDIAKKIGEELDLQVEIVDTKFSSLIPSIESGRLDMISAGMLISDKRAEIIDFSQPIYPYGEGLVILKGINDIKTFDDLKGKKVGVQEGTVYLDGIKEYPEVEYQSYTSIADMIKEVENGRIDAFYGDYPIIVDMLQKNPDFSVQLVKTYEPKWVGEIGLGFPKGSKEFQKAVNDVVTKLKENGELDKIIKKWGL